MQRFKEIWLMDFEFYAPPGERPIPLCMVALELKSGRLVRLWLDGPAPPAVPLLDVGNKSLFVAYYASAEIGCLRALRWPAPANLLDLFAEFRNQTNGLPVPNGNGLLGALAFYGLPVTGSDTKEVMRDLAQRGGPFTEDEKRQLLNYCEEDVRALERLFTRMEKELDLDRALVRG